VVVLREREARAALSAHMKFAPTEAPRRGVRDRMRLNNFSS
jgi:hypothetical protein